MNQTPAASRPRDARDQAAHCTAPDQNGQTHDGDCHINYTAKFVCAEAGPVAGRRTPSRELAIPFQPGAGSGSCPIPPATFKFTLAPQNAWLQGTSNDFGTDESSDPDYIFERGLVRGYTPPLNIDLNLPQNGGLSISTQGPVTSLVQVTVSSRDFGGSGRLYGQASIQGRGIFDIDLVESLQPDASGRYRDVLAPQGLCGDDFKRRPFASLPVDQNCNDIADSWEAGYGGNLAATADTDQADNNGSTIGDGLNVFEEYRGFHYIDRGSGSPMVRWTSTDPVRKLDLFFWDHDGLFAGDLAFFRSQFPFIELREVDGRMGIRYREGPNPLEPTVTRINSNSSSGVVTYPLLLVNRTLVDNSPGGNKILGHAPDGPPANGPDKRAIRLDHVNINLYGSSNQFPRSDWRQILVAHEIGHNLGLRHPIELRGFVNLPYITNFSVLSTLPLNKYTYDPLINREFYTWLKDYHDSSAGLTRRAEGVASGVGQLGGNKITQEGAAFFTVFAAPQRSLYWHLVKNPFAFASSLVVLTAPFNGSKANLMNWTPRLDPPFRSTSAFSFSGNDIRLVCVKSCPERN